MTSGAGKAVETVFHGASDVSAVVFLDPNHFVAADDETNGLRIYDVNCTEKPVSLLDLGAFLNVESQSPEADIEGTARSGDRIYWITSHGRNKDGKPRPNRHRFFCTKVERAENKPLLEPIGKPCRNLIQQFLSHPSPVYASIARAARYGESLSKKEQENLAPKEEGLNIEGLVYYPPHKSLLIGLRNPLYSQSGKNGGAAIVIELLNPQGVIEDGADARFGEVLAWNLADRGIRGIEYSSRYHLFFILAGAIDSETTFAMYRWDGDFTHQPELLSVWPEKDSFSPEGIAERPSDGLLWIFSDDGTLEIPVDSPSECMAGELLNNTTCPNKYLTDPARKTFRLRRYNPVDAGT